MLDISYSVFGASNFWYKKLQWEVFCVKFAICWENRDKCLKFLWSPYCSFNFWVLYVCISTNFLGNPLYTPRLSPQSILCVHVPMFYTQSIVCSPCFIPFGLLIFYWHRRTKLDRWIGSQHNIWFEWLDTVYK